MTDIYQRESYERLTSAEARELLVEAVARHRDFMLPMPLRACERCYEHAACYIDPETEWYICPVCAPRVSVFNLPVRADDIRVRAADAALEEAINDGRCGIPD